MMQPDVIVIAASHQEDVLADSADVLVTVHGSSLVTGRAALRKAKEVSELVAALQVVGFPQEDISLEGVRAHVSSGVLVKSSAAHYRLRLRCRDLERLPDVLGAVTSAKNASLDNLEWHYPDAPGQHIQWLESCIAQANVKAQAAAKALGVRLAGVHRLSEELLAVPGAAASPYGGRDGLARARIELGFELSHRKSQGLRVTVEYRVEGFEPPAIPPTP